MKKNNKILEENLEILAPTLFKIEKHNPFELPEGYFETLPHIIQEKCVAASQKKPFWDFIRIYIFRPRPLLAYACLTLLLIFGLHHQKNAVHVNPDDFTATFYLNELDESTIEEGSSAIFPESSVDKDAATDYFLEHNLDPNQINN